MSRGCFTGLAVLALALASCSNSTDRPPLFPVKGRVLVNGRPASGAVVIFHANPGGDAETSRPRGLTDTNGSFTLSTYGPGDGAPAGEYVVTVEWKRIDDHPEQGSELLPPAYTDPKISRLRAIVQAGSNEAIEFRLTRTP